MRTAEALVLFDRYAEMAAPLRALRLVELRRRDPELHAALEALLAADAMDAALVASPQEIISGGGETTPRVGAAEADPRIGTMLGPWRIDALIGSGGMGRVYRARRADAQYRQTVALKCIAAGAAAPLLADVIRNERAALAMLEHPNIATLLDGGVDAAGRPWFAMQRVCGEPLDAWCDRRRLELRARVRLFLPLCAGLAHAHARGMVHGDLKPANVLVDADGRPVLLDFGLSALLARGGTARPVAVTHGCTAPEVAQTGVSVASDIYALGVMLRSVLGGIATPPADVARGATPAALPSELARRGGDAAAQRRGLADAAALACALRGDLDQIIAACMATEPAARPASVARVRADLRAWLDARPIAARRRQPLYRLRLLLRRQRPAAVLAGLLLVATIAGVTGGIHLHERAAERAAAAQALQHLFADSFAMLTSGGLGQAPLMSAAMLQGIEARLRAGVDAAQGEDVAVLMLAALARSYTTLGDYPRAMALLDEAAQRSGARPGQQAMLAATRAHLLNIRSEHAAALQAARAGLQAVAALPQAERAEARLVLDVEAARARWGMGRIEAGRAMLGEALARAQALAEHDPRPLAALLIQEGQWLRLFSEYGAAAARFERAIELTRRGAPLLADEAVVELVPTLKNLNRHAQGNELATALLERRRHLLGDRHPETGKAWQVLAWARFWNGDAEGALAAARRSGEILEATLGTTHPETLRTTLAEAVIHTHAGRFDRGERLARGALAQMEAAYGVDHQETLRAVGQLAAILAVGAPARADPRAAMDEAIALFERRVRGGMRHGLPMLSERMVVIKARLRVGRVNQAARTDAEAIVASLLAKHEFSSDAVLNARHVLVEVCLAQGDTAAATALMQETLERLADAPTTMVTETARINHHEKLGDLAQAAGRTAAARRHWQQALAISRRIEPGAPAMRALEAKLERGASR